MSNNVSDRGLLQPEWDHQTGWTRFWHRPIRAEPLAAARIAFAFCLLCDQLVQYMPFLSYFYGPDGVAPAGVNDGYLSRQWRWPILFFYTDNLTVIYCAFYAWLISTVFFAGGIQDTNRGAPGLAWCDVFYCKEP